MKGKLFKTKDGWIVRSFDTDKSFDVMSCGEEYRLHPDHIDEMQSSISTMVDNDGREVEFYPIIDAKINMVTQFAVLTPKKDVFMKKDKINNGHYLELTDRVHVMSNMFEDHIYNHPLSEKDKEIKKITNKILSLLGELYQITGTKMHNEYEKYESPIHKVILGRHKKPKDRRMDNP